MIARHAPRAAWLALALAPGCTVDIPSTLCDTPNEAIVMSARIDDTGTNVHVEVAFHAEGEDVSRPFCVDDEVLINGRAAAALRKPNGHTVFSLNLGRPADAYVVRVVRGDDTHELRAAPNAPDFDLIAPAKGSQHARAEPLPIAWAPALGEPATLTLLIGDTIDGTACLAGIYSAQLVDDGGHEVPAQALEVAAGQLAGTAVCDGFIELVRQDAVAVESVAGDPFHADSRLVAATARTIAFTSLP